MIADHNLEGVFSAAGLVLAVLAAFYTLWLPAVTSALKITPKPDKDDRGPQREEVKSVMRTKALPLLFATLISALILSPRGIVIICEVFKRWRMWEFDDAKALFVLTFMLMWLLAFVSGSQAVALRRKLKDIDA